MTPTLAAVLAVLIVAAATAAVIDETRRGVRVAGWGAGALLAAAVAIWSVLAQAPAPGVPPSPAAGTSGPAQLPLPPVAELAGPDSTPAPDVERTAPSTAQAGAAHRAGDAAPIDDDAPGTGPGQRQAHPHEKAAPAASEPDAGAAVGDTDAAGITGPCVASWYGEDHRGLPTASGAPFDPDRLTVATWDLPFGTHLEVVGPDGTAVVVEVTDRGPARRLARCLDLSAAAFALLAPLGRGLIDVTYREVTP